MRWWRDLSLSYRVPLVVAVLMAAVAAVASQLVLIVLDRQQETRIRELARLHVESLSVALGAHVLRKDVWEIYDTLERAAGASAGRRNVFSGVADTRGRVLAATDPRRAPVDSPIEAIAAGAQSPAKLILAEASDRVRLRAPLVYQGREVGQILTDLDISDLQAERRRIRQLLIFGNALATGFLALVGYLATRRMLAPISRLADWMEETEGTPRPIPDRDMPRGDNELNRLVRIYNRMVGAIAEKADTERRMAERERFVSLGRLSSSLAHEINNPLGGLLNATDTIRSYADRPEVVRKSADLLARGLRHLRDVARATLDMNRFSRSAAPLSAEDFEDLRLLIGPELRMHGQEFDWDVPSGDADLDALPSAQVRQIALNLLLNASQAAGRGGRVGLRVAAEDGPRLRIEVSDSGPGLSGAARTRLLGGGPVPAASGGVGLRLVRDLVARLGGEIEVDRVAGMTRIRVSLPMPQAGAAPGADGREGPLVAPEPGGDAC